MLLSLLLLLLPPPLLLLLLFARLQHVAMLKKRQQEATTAKNESKTLDDDAFFAIAAYTYHGFGVGAENQIYYALNRALRNRRVDKEPFEMWSGFLYHLERGLNLLDSVESVVFRGGNKGIDQATAKREYTVGRPIQWAAFSSTSLRREAAANFATKGEGVLFVLKVRSGTAISHISMLGHEDEVLLSPNTRFTVTRDLYFDKHGVACVDMVETQPDVHVS